MANKIVLVSMLIEIRRMGELDGLFICDQELLEALYGQEAYFGECLGKHSDIAVTLQPSHFTIKSDDREFIKKMSHVIGSVDISGMAPFDYVNGGDMPQLSVESITFLGDTQGAIDVV